MKILVSKYLNMDIKIIQTKGKPAQVVLDLNLFISIISPEKAKDIQNVISYISFKNKWKKIKSLK